MEETYPPQTMNSAGFEPTRVRQFTIFLENRVGQLQMLVRAFEEATGRIMALSIQNSADTALVRLICSDPDLGKDVLAKGRFFFTEQDVLVVEIPRRSREPMVELCSTLLSAEINIHYAYPLLVRPSGPALAMCVDDPVLAAQLLIRKGFTLIAESDLSK
jgi:hypothetical protein